MRTAAGALLMSVGLVACGAAATPATATVPSRCHPSSYRLQPLSGAHAGAPDPVRPPSSTTPVSDTVSAIGLAVADRVAADRCAHSSTITTTGVPVTPTPGAPAEPAPAPLAFAAIDEGHFACRSVSGLEDLVVSESIGDATHACEQMTGEPCDCSSR